MPDTPKTLTCRYHRAAYDEKLLQFARQTLKCSRDLLEKTRPLVSRNSAGPFIKPRNSDPGECARPDRQVDGVDE